ncbi:MAG: hypothetical protein ACXW2E_02035 [Nitrososphaeraceae archaeon]
MSTIMLIEELSSSESKLIQESSQDGKSMWLNGIFMQSDIQNRNGRNYPLSEITNAVKTMSESIKSNNGVFGELDHPSTLQINSDRISHVITEMKMIGNNAIGKAKLLNTPMGLIAQELIKSNVKIGVSSRGAGNVNESGVVSGFNVVTVDLVISPSAPNATPSYIYESLDSLKGNKVMTLAEQMQQDTTAQKYFKKEILKWIQSDLFKTK